MHGSLQPERDLLQLDQDSLWERLQRLRDGDDPEMNLIDELDSGSRPSTASSADSHESIETNDITGLRQRWRRRQDRLHRCRARLPTLRRRLADFEHAFKSNGIQEEDNDDANSRSDDDSVATDGDWEPQGPRPTQNTQFRTLLEDHPELASAHDKHASKLDRAYKKIERYEQLVGQAREMWNRAVQVGKEQRRQPRQYQRKRELKEAETARQMAELQAQKRRRTRAPRDTGRRRMQEQKAPEGAAEAAETAEHEHEKRQTREQRSRRAVAGQQTRDVLISEHVMKRRQLDPIRQPFVIEIPRRSTTSMVSLDSISDIE